MTHHHHNGGGSTVLKRTDAALHGLGKTMTGLAGSLRQKSESSTVQQLAARLQSGGSYLSDHGVEDLGDELGGIIRANPVKAMWIGLGLGLLLGAALAPRRQP
jgi:ElaB/YqjD/DUF883 family membrane-anchored ribosome-binding protein